MHSPTPLPADKLYRAFDATTLPFETTVDLPDGLEIIGQQRAIDAIRFGIGMRHQGYNPVSYTHLTLPTNREV